MAIKEIPWINWVKVICIFFVYLYHTSVYCGYDERLLYPIYAPFFTNAFFFVSGYLIFRKQLQIDIISIPAHKWVKGGGSLYVENVFFRIIIPTILFATLNYFPKVFLRGQGVSGWPLFRDTVLGGSLWFTSALSISELVLFIMLLSRRRDISFYTACSIIVASVGLVLAKSNVLFLNDPNIPWFYKTGLFATIYLIMGGIYWRVEEKMNHTSRQYLCCLFCALFIGFYFLVKGKAQISINVLRINFVGIVLSVLGILALVYICQLLPSHGIINWLGRHTLGLYFLSGGIPNVLSILWLKAVGAISITFYILISICSFLLGVLCVFMIDRFLPFVFDLRLLHFGHKL